MSSLTETPKETSQQKSSALPEAWVERLFLRLSAMYGKRFSDMWSGVDLQGVKSVWAMDLGGFTGDEIAAGVEACKSKEWPPTLPEFMKLCRPDRSEEAFRKAVKLLSTEERDYANNNVLYWSIQRFGEFDLKQTTWDRGKQRWKDIYTECENNNRRGLLPIIPEKRGALPAPGGTVASPEEVEKIIQKACTGLNRIGDKAWADRLKKRHESGEQLLPVPVRFYREALEIAV